MKCSASLEQRPDTAVHVPGMRRTWTCGRTCWASSAIALTFSTKLRRLLDAGIEIHAQVVLCPTINDGEVLRQTITDLAAYYPRVSSVAIDASGLDPLQH